MDINSKFVIRKEVLDYDSLQLFNLSLRMNSGFKEFGFNLEVAWCFECVFGKELWVYECEGTNRRFSLIWWCDLFILLLTF